MPRNKTKSKLQVSENAQPKKKLVKQVNKSGGMLVWVIILSLILPFLYSATTLDPVVSIRYVLLCIFISAFIFFFFVIRENHLFPAPPLIRLMILVGIVFGIWNIITQILGFNPVESFFEAGRPFANLLFILIVMVAVYYDKNKLIALCNLFVVSAILHSIIGIFQFYELGFNNIPGNFAPYGLMANRNLYGAAQMLLLPFCIYVIYSGNKLWKIISLLAALSLTISILLSQTRAAWLAAILIVFLSLILVILFVAEYRKKWLIASSVGIGCAMFVIFLFVFTNKDSKLSQSLKDRTSLIAKPLSDTATGATAASTANERLVIWNKSLQLIKEYPLLGVGPGNWKIGIQKYGNEGLINEYGNYIMDHAHNIYLQLASETGIPGLVLFLVFWILVVLTAFNALRKANTDEKILVILMVSGVAGFALNGFFNFPTERIEHSFYLYLMGGIILGMYSLHHTTVPKYSYSIIKWRLAPLILSIGLLFVAKKRYDFDVHFYRVKALNKTNRFQEAIAEVEEGKSNFGALDLNGDPISMYGSIAYKELKQYDKALNEAQLALKHHPYNARVYNTLGTIYTETFDYPKAIDAYKKSLSITSKYDVTLKNLAVNYYYIKDYAKCLQVLEQIKIGNDPVLLEIKNTSLQQLGRSNIE